MRVENSCAPASRSKPRARGASETGGTDLQELGLPAELQLPLLPLPRHRRCRCQRLSEEWQHRKNKRKRRTPLLYETSACAHLLTSGPSSRGRSGLQLGAFLWGFAMTRFVEDEGRDVLWDPTPPPAIEKWPASGPPQNLGIGSWGFPYLLLLSLSSGLSALVFPLTSLPMCIRRAGSRKHPYRKPYD